MKIMNAQAADSDDDRRREEPDAPFADEQGVVLMICGACETIGYAHDRFCPCCGAEMQRRCGACGRDVDHPIANYCTGCGASLKSDAG